MVMNKRELIFAHLFLNLLADKCRNKLPSSLTKGPSDTVFITIILKTQTWKSLLNCVRKSMGNHPASYESVRRYLSEESFRLSYQYFKSTDLWQQFHFKQFNLSTHLHTWEIVCIYAWYIHMIHMWSNLRIFFCITVYNNTSLEPTQSFKRGVGT